MQVALIQMAVTDFQNRQERFQKIEQFLEEIERDREKKPDLIVFPELWGCGFQNFSGYIYTIIWKNCGRNCLKSL